MLEWEVKSLPFLRSKTFDKEYYNVTQLELAKDAINFAIINKYYKSAEFNRCSQGVFFS